MLHTCLITTAYSLLSTIRYTLTYQRDHLFNVTILPFLTLYSAAKAKRPFIDNTYTFLSLFSPVQFSSDMEDLSKVWIGPLPPDSPYVKPFRFYYVQNGVEKNWDLLKVHDSVAIILFNKTRNVLVFVKQFRPAVYHGYVTAAGANVNNVDIGKFPAKLGVTLELCAGIVDKAKSCVEIAREELIEECGYDVPVNRIEEVITFRSGVGSSGAEQIIYYCEVTDDDKVNSGGGVDGEIIEVVEYSLENARKLVSQGAVVNSPPSFLFGVLWFLTNRAPKA